MNRRKFIHDGGFLFSLSGINISWITSDMSSHSSKTIIISNASAAVENEPLARPFGFKGGYLTELWQSAVKLESKRGSSSVGLGTQSVLWSDSGIFSTHTETEGNSLMFALTKKATEILNGRSFQDPISLLDSILDEVYDYGKKITGKENLRKTFALNALVPVDNAVWLLYARENGIRSFDEMIPASYRKALSVKHNKIAYIPLISYNVPVEELKNSTKMDGSFFIKIKLGQPGTQQEMLEKDKANLTRIHEAIGDIKTPYTSSGKLLYYFDANGRYESKDTLKEFITHAKNIGAFDQIAILEEPFPEESDTDVSDLGLRISADESAHTDTDVVSRIQKGYSAIALKPIAKTLSMTLKMVKKAHEKGIPCFCADLTVNPILVEWNRNIAARLAPLPGLTTGLLETNGAQNYKHWEALSSYSPSNGQSWTKINKGVFELDQNYYKNSGGIFSVSRHYESLFQSIPMNK
jgi:L-alanine-DL-glutamate epimerase-like enolase superfamily enzyme